MKMTKIASGIAAATVSMSIHSPATAKQCMSITVDSQSGCYVTKKQTYAYAGSEEFKFELASSIGKAEAVQETCPDAHVSILPTDKSRCD